MDLGVLSATLSLDSTAFQEGLAQAQGALASFSSIAAGVFSGVGASGFFDQLTGGLQGITSLIVGQTSDFQSYGQTFANTLANISDQYSGTSSSIASGSAKQKASILEAQDALIKYNEKIADIQSNIATVMSGDNVIQAQEKFASQLEALQQSYADKVTQINDEIAQTYSDLADRKADIEQKAADTISDMQASHDNSMADKKEKQALELSKTNSAVVKAALQKQYDEENKLAEDSYQRQLATKQAELARNVKEEEDAAQEAADKKVAKLQEQLSREAALEQQKEDKLKAQEADEIARLDAENAKKLAKYQQELADEERAYALSQAKRAASGGSQGGGGNVSLGHLAEIGKDDPFAAANESLEKLQGNIVNFALKSPFNLHDIEQADQGVAAIGLNVEKMNPIIGDLAGHWHKTFNEAFIAIQNASLGNSRILQNQFHVTKDDLTNAFGGPIKSVNDFATAMQKLDEDGKLKGSFKGGQLAAFETLPGQMSNVQDQITRLAISFMGFDPGKTMKEQDPNSLFMILYSTIKQFADFLASHRDEFAKALTPLARAIGDTLKVLIPLIENIILFATHHPKLVATVVLGVSIFSTLFGIFTSLLPIIAGVVLAFAVLGAGLATLFLFWIPLGIAVVAGLAAAYTTNFLHIRDIVNTVVKFIVSNFMNILNFIAPGSGTLITAVTYLFTHWSTILASIQKAVGDFVKFLQSSWGTVIKDLGDLMTNIGNFFTHAVHDFEQWGQNLIKAFADGIKNAAHFVIDAVGNVLNAAKKMLAGKSPPEEGPFHEIDDWGFNVGAAWVEGFQKAIGGLQLPNVSSLNSGLGGQSHWNYNTTNNLRTSNLTMNNNFSISGQASAMNMIEYLAFQSNHFGAV